MTRLAACRRIGCAMARTLGSPTRPRVRRPSRSTGRPIDCERTRGRWDASTVHTPPDVPPERPTSALTRLRPCRTPSCFESRRRASPEPPRGAGDPGDVACNPSQSSSAGARSRGRARPTHAGRIPHKRSSRDAPVAHESDRVVRDGIHRNTPQSAARARHRCSDDVSPTPSDETSGPGSSSAWRFAHGPVAARVPGGGSGASRRPCAG